MKSELLRKALMAKMAVGGDVEGGDDPIKSAKKVTKIPEGYVEVKDAKGNVVKNEAGEVLYKKESKKTTPSTKPFTKPEEGKLKQNIQTSQKKPIDTGLTTKVIKKDMPKKKETSEVDYLYLGQESTKDKDKSSQQIEKKAETKVPENKWGTIWGGERKWSRASQGMSPIYDKSGNKMLYESIDIPAQWDAKNNRWETAGGWGKPTTLYGVDVNGKLEVFDPSSSPVSYTEKGAPYYDYEKLSKPTGMYGKQSDAALKEGPLRVLHGYGAAQTQPFKGEYDPSLDVKQSINRIGDGSMYNPVQPKKKGGIVARYKDGTQPSGIDPNVITDETNMIGGKKVNSNYKDYVLRATKPNELQDMNVEDTDMSGFNYKMPSSGISSSGSKIGGTASAGSSGVSNIGKASSGIGGKSSGTGGNFDSGKLLSSDLISTAGEVAGSSIDALDRKDGRSSIAGQTASGAVKGAAKGYQMAGVPGAIILGSLEAAMGARRGVKEKKERLKTASESARSAAIAAQEYDPLNPNPQSQGVEVHKNDIKGGLAGLFANGGQVKQISNSANKINYAKGGTIKGAGTGTSDSIVTDINKKGIPEGSFIAPAKNNEMAKGIRRMVLGQNPNKVAEFKKGGTPKSDKVAVSNGEHLFTPAEKEKITRYLGKEILEKLAPEAEENEMEKNKGGEMIKRTDGSYSKRGLWDNIRANAGSGKKPTAEMLKQEKEIIAEKAKGGYVVKRSSERKGKTHVVTGPDGTKKYFGDSNLGQHPNDPARKKAFYARHEKNLKKNPYFRAFARETWAEGGTVGSTMEKANGGNVTPADKTKVKSYNVYKGKVGNDKPKEYGITEFARETRRSDGTSKYEVMMPEGKWKTTYNLEKKYETVKKANGGNVVIADNTRVKSPNVYEGKIGSNKNETISTIQEYRETKRNDGTSKVEVKMPDGTWKTTYNLEKKYETVKKAQGGELTKSKAKEILHDKSVHGKPLTDKQRKYMGWVAGGKKNMGGIVGKYAMGGNVNRDWDWG
jgi:hypothetical protein